MNPMDHDGSLLLIWRHDPDSVGGEIATDGANASAHLRPLGRGGVQVDITYDTLVTRKCFSTSIHAKAWADVAIRVMADAQRKLRLAADVVARSVK